MMKLETVAFWILVLGLFGPSIGGASDLTAPAHPALDQGSVSYTSGGFSKEDREDLAAAAKAYNLKLVFAGKGSGAYLADVKVSIMNMKGQKTLEAVSSGPWFFARLPAGHYRISAEAEGRSLVQKATVTGGRLTQLHFYWPVEDGQP